MYSEKPINCYIKNWGINWLSFYTNSLAIKTIVCIKVLGYFNLLLYKRSDKRVK